MNIRIDYYTGTGGTEMAAKKIADELIAKGCAVTANRIIRDKFIIGDDFDYYVLLFAVHSFGVPRPALEWVEKLEGKGRTCAVIAVSGGGEIISNTACRRKIIKRLSAQRFDVIYENMVQMPNNWMNVPKQEKCEKILTQYPIQCREIAEAIFSEQRRRKAPLWIDILISALGETEKGATRKFGQGIKTTDRCTGCGLCARRCGSSNITIENGRAVVGDQCDMCLGCIYGCPEKALVATYGGFQVDKKGYDLKLMNKNINKNHCNAKDFCTCPVEKCPRHPKNHDQGCDPCIQDNLKRGKMPACFFRVVHNDVSEAKDFTIEGFVNFFTTHKEEYGTKFKKNK